jgi:hypothetical protein
MGCGKPVDDGAAIVIDGARLHGNPACRLRYAIRRRGMEKPK